MQSFYLSDLYCASNYEGSVMFSKRIYCLLGLSLSLSAAFPCFSDSQVPSAIMAESFEVTGHLTLVNQRYIRVECTEKLILGAKGQFGVTLTSGDQRTGVRERAFVELSDLDNFIVNTKSLLSLERNSVGSFENFTARVTSKNSQLAIVRRSVRSSVYSIQFISSGFGIDLSRAEIELVVRYLEASLKKMNALT